MGVDQAKAWADFLREGGGWAIAVILAAVCVMLARSVLAANKRTSETQKELQLKTEEFKEELQTKTEEYAKALAAEHEKHLSSVRELVPIMRENVLWLERVSHQRGRQHGARRTDREPSDG